MDILIERMNELQNVCTKTGIQHNLELPQIVVIGSQSSGKSSVLENIVGRDFLPRGYGMITRRPLILQLIYCNTDQDYCIFGHNNKKYTDFEQIKLEIINETSKILKNKNDVSQNPIILKLYSKKVLTLTLVDLPGLIKVPTSDQPKNICLKIEEICKKFISNRNAIILAVSAATNDIANSEALHLAKIVDPNYERTIGVLTKVDLMDKGTDCIEILAGKIINLKLGFIPVVNRSQKDIDNKKDIKDALKAEKQFFESHPSYKRNKDYCGTDFLVKKLQSILHEHIKICLPSLQEKINNLLIENEKELMEIGANEISPKESILGIISETSKKFSEYLKGELECNSNEIVGGARLNYTFNLHFSEFIQNLKPLEHIKDEDIRTILYNSTGSKSVILFSQNAFEKLVQNSISILKPYSLKLVSVIFSEMVKILHQVTNQTLKNYTFLREHIHISVTEMFKINSENTYKLVSSFLDWNIKYINTRHPDFLKLDDILTEKKENQPKQNKKISFDLPNILKITGNITQEEQIEIDMIKSLVSSYFEIIKKIVIDQVPKAIMSEFVYKSEETLQEILFKDVYENEKIESLIRENDEIKEIREKLKNNIKTLRRAYEIMCTI